MELLLLELMVLIVGANGTYTYVADQSAADDLDASDTATDSFTYTISDGTTQTLQH